MKRIKFTLFFFCVFFLCVVNYNALTGYTTESYISVRTEATVDSERVALINKSNTELNLVDNTLYNVGDENCNIGWYKIIYENNERYICGEYVTVGETGASSEIINTDTYEARITAMNVYIWAGPGYGYSAVTFLLPGTNLTILEENVKGTGCSKGWDKVRYYDNQIGYVCSNNISKKSDITDTDTEYENYLKSAGFPDTYIPYLVYLHKLHPSWTFNAIQTGLYWDNVVSGESNKNLLPVGSLSSSAKNAYLASFEPVEGSYWMYSKDSVNAFYLDPRNFLTERFIFMFESLSYDYGEGKTENLDKENPITQKYYEAITELLGSSYLNTDEYKYYFIDAGFKYNVNPVHLVSRVYQEGGSKETYGPVSGTVTTLYGNYSVYGYYNYYNIGAYNNSVTSNPQLNGIAFACGEACGFKNTYGRPWDTREKAIYGGAEFLAENYIAEGQNTMYFEKFNTSPYATARPYTHQYMTNVLSPASEAESAYESYLDMNFMDLAFTFDIPVYLDMPESVSLPSVASTVNTLSSITINGSKINGFDKDIVNYNYYVSKDTTSVNIDAVRTDTKSIVTGLGKVDLIDQELNYEIEVTSESGAKRIYKIKFIKVEDARTVDDIISELSVKTNDDLMYYISPKTQTNTLIQNILKKAPAATITITDKDGKAVDDSSSLKTGYLIHIVAPSGDSKTYSIAVNGDVSGDGEVTILDLLKVQKHLLKSSKLDGASLKAADTNNDNDVTIVDLLRIQKAILKHIEL